MKSLLVSAALVAAFSCPAFANPLPTPADPAATCDLSVSVPISGIEGFLAKAGITAVTALPVGAPEIAKALQGQPEPTPDQVGLKGPILGWFIDTHDGNYFAHPYDANCIAGAALAVEPIGAKPAATKPSALIFDNHA